MDESFLSDAEVIKASRNFVCIRLATYEDASEAEFLKTVFVNRSGDLENTVFVLLSPDTKKDLCRAGRGPNFAFQTPKIMAEAMNKIAKTYPAEVPKDSSALKLPQMKNVRLGLNVSSCDGLPAVMCVAENKEQLAEMQSRLAGLAFSDELAGKFVFASTTDPAELNSVENYDGGPGFVLVQPDEFGLKGKLIKTLNSDATVEQLKAAMVAYANEASKVKKRHNQHVRKGNQEGKEWETEIPVTDPNSIRAMDRNKRQRGVGGPPPGK